MPIVAETPETTEARIAGKNDAKGFQWEWFAASYMTTNASVIAIALVYWFSESYLFSANACLLTMYGIMPIVAETPETTEARIAGKNDAKGFHCWEWFARPDLVKSGCWGVGPRLH